jgi:S-layer protein
MAIATTAQLTQISSLYVALFNRAPDTVGLSFWGNALANGAALATISQGFLNAPEGTLNYPAFQSSSEFVTAFYTKVFGRAPDAGGLAFWTTALNNAGGAESTTAKASVVSQIISTVNTPLTTRPAGLTDAEYAQTVSDRALFANKVDVGTYLATQSPLTVPDAGAALTGVTADPATVVTAKSALFATAITNALTGTGAVVLGSTGSDIFNLTDAQLTAAPAGFSLNGNTGVDTLVLTTTGGPSITDAVKNISNVEIINVSGALGTTTTLAAARFAGATTFGSTGAGSLTVTGLDAGQNLAILKTGNTTATYLAGATTASLNISGGASGTVAINGAGLTSVALTSTGVTANTTGVVTLAGTVGAVSIDATSGLTTTLAGGKASSALTLTGGGAVNLNTVPGTFTSINASGASGGLTATVGAAITTLTGSSGADKIAVAGALGAGANVTLGDGNDTLTGSGGSVTTGATIDGGGGTDTISTALINAGNAASFKNFEQIQVEGNTIVDSSLLTGSTLTGITIANSTGGGAVNNVASTVGLTATGTATGTTSISVTGALANTADTYTVTLANATANTVAAAGTIGLANVETINLVSAGTATAGSNSIEIADAAMKNLVITGDKAVSVTFATTTTGTSSIDASAATGAVTLDTTGLVATAGAGGGLTVKGGTGADQLTVTQAATVTSGAGADIVFAGANTITVGTPGSATATELQSKLLTVTDFARGDTVDLRVGGVPGTAVSLGTVTDLSAESDVVAAAALAANTTATAAAGGVEVSAFRFGGDTYVLLDAVGAGTGGVATNDVLVKLSGVLDLSTATVDVGTGAVLYV